ncbi:hypothetical protein [Pectobacterium sp. PL152]|uniref:hypothetical protein n=1 Tax=Pectobacterium sp. PL152 TaxID=2859229 RepID=UPI003D7E0A00|nr:hypothetical protein KXZ65_06040 [Pectobacterium sp. PL152]
MPPGQRQPQSNSDLNVAGRSSFNIMWHYAKAAERGPRVTHYVGAGQVKGALRATSASACGWPPGFGSTEQRGAQGFALCCEHQRASLASTVWPPSLAELAPASTFSKHQRQQNRGCRPDGLR